MEEKEIENQKVELWNSYSSIYLLCNFDIAFNPWYVDIFFEKQ